MLYQNVFYLLLQHKYFEFQGDAYKNNNNLERRMASFYLIYIQHCLYY